jgi:hypothetical protein
VDLGQLQETWEEIRRECREVSALPLDYAAELVHAAPDEDLPGWEDDARLMGRARAQAELEVVTGQACPRLLKLESLCHRALELMPRP